VHLKLALHKPLGHPIAIVHENNTGGDHSQDNHMWHIYPKVYLNKFDGSDAIGWVT
jgi:hypothetical protein